MHAAPVVSSTPNGGFSPEPARAPGFFLAVPVRRKLLVAAYDPRPCPTLRTRAPCHARRRQAAEAAERRPARVAALSANDYLKKILTARVYDVAVQTALDPARNLSRRIGNQVLLKREDQQPVFSFKLRGAYNKMAQLDADALARGVICASAGNHAQGVALAARKLGCKATIVMPVSAPRLKVDAVHALGGEVVLHGDSFNEAQAHAAELQAAKGLTLVPPFDDPDVIAGQGTVAMEILRQHQGPLDAIFVAIGGGGLISGVAAYVKAIRPEVKVDWRADDRLRRHAALGAGRQAGDARRRGPLRRRHGGEMCGRRDLSPDARAGGRLRRR